MAPGGAFFVMALFMVFHRKSTKADYPDTDDNDTFMYYHRHGKDIFAILRSIAEFLSLLLLVQGIEPNPGPLAYGSESSIDVDLRKKKTKPGTIPFNKGEITSLNDEEQTSTTYVESALSASRRGTRSGPSLDDDFCSFSSTESTDCGTDDTERTQTDVSNSVVKSHKYKKKRAKRVSGGPQTRPSMDDKLCSYSSTDSDSDDLVKYRKEKVQLAWSTSHSEKTSSQSDIKVSEEIDNESESDSTVSTACSKDGQVKQTSNVKVPKFTNYDVKDYARTDDDMDCYTDLEYDDDYKVVFSPSYEKLNSGKEKNTSTSNKLVPEKDNNGNSNGNIKTKDVQDANHKDEHNASVKPQSDIKEVTGEVNDGKNTGCESAKVTEKTRSRTNVDTKDLKSDSGSTSCSTYSQNVRKSVSKTPLQKAEEVNDKSDWSSNSHPTSCSTCPQNRPTSHPSSCSTCPQNRPASHPSSCSTCPKNRPASHPSSCSTCPTNRKAKTSGNKGKDISTRSSSLDNMTPSKRGVANKDESDWSSNSHPSPCPPNRRAVSSGIRSTSLSDKILSQTNADKSDLGSASPPTSNSTSTQSRHALANIKLVDDISISTNKSTHVQNVVNVATNYCENINVVDLENKSRKSIDSLLDDNEISCQDKSRKSASFVSVKDDAKTSSSTESKEFKFVEDIRSLRSLEIKTLSQHDEAIKDESDWDSDTESSFKSHSKHGSKSVVDNEMTIDAMNKSDITNNKSNDADIEKPKTSYKTNLEPVASCESVKSDIKSSEIETPKIIDNIRSLRSLSFAQEDCLSNNDQKARSNIISPALHEDNGNEEAAGRNSDANNCSPSSSFDIDKNIVKIDEDDISMLFRRGAHAIPLTKDPSTMDDDFCCKTSSSGGSKSENVKVLDQNNKFKASRSNMSAGDIANGGNINVEDVKRSWKDGVKELTGVNMKTTEMCGDALNFNIETNDVQEAVVNKTDDNGKPCRSVSLDANLCSRNDKKINSKFISSSEGVSKFSNYDVKDYADTDDDMACYTDLEYDDDYKVTFSPSFEKLNDEKKTKSTCSSHSVEKPESFVQAIDKSGLDDVESCISVASTSYSLRPTSLHIKYDDIVFESISTYPNRITTTFQDLSEVSSCYDGTVVNSAVAIQKVKDVSNVATQVDKVKYTLVSNKKTQVEDICDKHFVDKGVQYDLNESSRIHVTKNKLVQVDKFFKKETVDKEIQYERNYTNTFKDHETQVEDLCKKEVHDMTTQVDKIVVCNQGIQVQNKPTEDKGIQFKSIFVNDANIKQNKEVQVDTIYKRKIEEKGTQYEPIHSYWAKLSMDKETQVENIDRKMVEDKSVQAETNVTNVPKTYDANIVAEEYCDNTSQNKKIQVENVNERVENKRRGVKRSRSKRKVTYYSDEDPPVKDTFNKGIQVEDTRCKEVHEKRNRGEDLINGNSCTINIQNMVIHMNQIQAEATVDKTTDRGVNCVKEMDIETNKCRSIMPYPPSPTLKVYSISSPVVQNSRKRKLLTEKQQKKNETKSNSSTVNESGYEQQAMATSATIREASIERTNYWPLASTTEPQINENRVNRKRKWQNGTRKSDKQSVKSTQSTSDVTNSRSIIEPCTAYRESSRTRKSKETIPARKEVKPKVKKTVAFQEPDNQQIIISTLCQSKSETLLVESCQGDETLLSNKSEGFIKNIVQLFGKEIDEALEKKMNRLDSVHIKNNHNRSPVNDKTTRVHDPYADMKPEYLSMFDNNKCEDKTVEKENIGNKKETIKDVKIENEKKKKKKSGFIGFLRRLFKK
ncbi:hypothetical protein ACF0H5_010848 [Mactra antiquata]